MMKAIIRATDKLDGKSVEIESSIYKDKDAATELANAVRRKPIRERIIRELRLSFGEAQLELICYGRVLATGTLTNNVFSGRGNIVTKNAA